MRTAKSKPRADGNYANVRAVVRCARRMRGEAALLRAAAGYPRRGDAVRQLADGVDERGDVGRLL